MPTTLVIEDEPVLARNVCESLQMAGHDTLMALSGEDGLKLAEQHAPDLILLDYRLPSIDGLEVLRRLREQGHRAAVILVTAHGDIETAVEAMKGGASDFLNKPLDLDELHLVAQRALEHRRVSTTLGYLRDRERAQSALDGILGTSDIMQTVKALIRRISAAPALAMPRPPSLLITGETGTGKDLAARAVHYAGPRHEAQFVHVNCTAIPDNLFESELFGHVKGAFTDARAEKRGLFEVADGGTLFLDELGHMKLPLQAKLLSALDQSAIRPIGSTRERSVDVHVVAATNRNLEEAIAAGEFREDLYHRLRVLGMHMPPLRERGDDILLLADHFLQLAVQRYGVNPVALAPAARARLVQHDWPGNVRELLHVIESAILVCDGAGIDESNLNLPPARPRTSLRIELRPQGRTLDIDFADQRSYLDHIEFHIIDAALEYTKHNLTGVARLLGVSRDIIRNRIEKQTRD